MNHRIVSAVISLVVLLFVAAALLFAVGVRPPIQVASTGKPAAIPHGQTEDYARCTDCHGPGEGAVALPPTHRRYAPTTCALCHAPLQP